MVPLSPALVDRLGDLVVDVKEGFAEGAWTIGAALDQNRAFKDSNGPMSSLRRSIIVREFKTCAERRGIDVRPGQGGAIEVYERNNDDYAVIRLRSAELVAGELRVISNNGSTWGGISDDGFWREVPYVMGWLPQSSESLDFFVAEVTSKTDASVPCLEFGWLHRFGVPAPNGGTSFKPDAADSLEGWDLPSLGEISDGA